MYNSMFSSDKGLIMDYKAISKMKTVNKQLHNALLSSVGAGVPFIHSFTCTSPPLGLNSFEDTEDFYYVFESG
jgi:hypothetical protein